jgi:hypothetical protein
MLILALLRIYLTIGDNCNRNFNETCPEISQLQQELLLLFEEISFWLSNNSYRNKMKSKFYFRRGMSCFKQASD